MTHFGDDLGRIAFRKEALYGGGPGSGSYYHYWRPTKKTTVEECRSLDTNRWMREGIIAAQVCHYGNWVWYRDRDHKEITSTISYCVNTLASLPKVRLTYTFTESKLSIDYSIPLTSTRPRFGGIRWWFRCPLAVRDRPCLRRVGKLYLPPGGRYFGCRHCYGLTYTSCQDSHRFDRLYSSIALNVGCEPADVRRVLSRRGWCNEF
jgi:hypothetical protein